MSTSTFEVLREIIARDYALAPESLTPETRLDTLAMDSLALIELLFTLEDRFAIVATNVPEDFQTLADVVSYIDDLRAPPDARDCRDMDDMGGLGGMSSMPDTARTDDPRGPPRVQAAPSA